MLQKAQGRKRKYHEAKADLVARVVEETRRLSRMQHAFGAPIPDGSAANTRASFSVTQTSLQHAGRERLP